MTAVDDAPAVYDDAERTVRALCEHPLLDVTWSRYEAGQSGPPLHIHHQHVDSFYVVEGELLFRVGPAAQEVRAPAGTFVLVPPEIVHTFDNASGAPARWLNFHAPSTGFMAYLRGDRPGFDSDDPPPDGGRPFGDATITQPGTHGVLGRAPQFYVRELAVAAEEVIERDSDGVNAIFVLDGDVEFGVDGTVEHGCPLTWFSVPPRAVYRVRSLGPARLLSVSAPGN